MSRTTYSAPCIIRTNSSKVKSFTQPRSRLPLGIISDGLYDATRVLIKGCNERRTHGTSNKYSNTPSSVTVSASKRYCSGRILWFKSHIAVSSVRFVMSAGRYLIPLGSNDRSVCIPQPISQTHRPSAHKAAANGARLFQLDLKLVDCDHRKWSVSRRLIDFKRRLISTNIRLSKIACMPHLGRPTHVPRSKYHIYTLFLREHHHTQRCVWTCA
jgi:hypothetical protein